MPISNTFKQRLEKLLLNGLRYCCSADKKGGYPDLDVGEFYGTDAEPGFLDAVASTVNYERRLAFFAGYRFGVKDAVIDLGSPDFEIDEQVGNIGAWKAWETYDE